MQISILLALLPALGADPPLREGPHALLIDVGTRSRVPVAGTTDVVTRSLLRVEVSRTATGWVQTQEVCAARVLSDTRAQTVLPDAFIEAMPTQRYPVTLTRTSSGWRWRADPGPSPIGYDPERTGGSVPTEVDAPGVIDHEGDGHPGATVLLEVPVLGSVRLYIAQNSWIRYHGIVNERGRVTGKVEQVSTTQHTLGASAPLFDADPEITAVPEKSHFMQAPLASSRSCSELVGAWSGGWKLP